MDLNKIGNFISECRKEKGYSQVELANRLNISNKTVSKWERGNGFPDLNEIYRKASQIRSAQRVIEENRQSER